MPSNMGDPVQQTPVPAEKKWKGLEWWEMPKIPACDPRYSGDRQEDSKFKVSLGKLARHYPKIRKSKELGTVAQCCKLGFWVQSLVPASFQRKESRGKVPGCKFVCVHLRRCTVCVHV